MPGKPDRMRVRIRHGRLDAGDAAVQGIGCEASLVGACARGPAARACGRRRRHAIGDRADIEQVAWFSRGEAGAFCV
jgi:hypothetical protein